MHNIFLRNFLTFAVISVLLAGSLIWFLIRNDRQVAKSDYMVNHTNAILVRAEKMGTLIEGILADQRGYIMTADKTFLTRYDLKKAEFQATLNSVVMLTSDSLPHQNRLKIIRKSFADFTRSLENRAETFTVRSLDDRFFKGVKTITGMRDELIRLNNEILRQEHDSLRKRIVLLEDRKSDYLRMLVGSLAIGTVILLTLNGFLFFAQKGRLDSEMDLNEAEDRFTMVIDGTQDGVYDWDMTTGQMYFSGRYFEMLGYKRKGGYGTPQDFHDLLHPDDAGRVKEYIDLYLKGGLSEYSIDFRMKGASGRWIWIQSRGKARFDANGKPVRMVGSHTDITAFKQSQARLEEEKNRAQSANRAKSEFLAHMSHEIRTPLTAISGIAEILEKNQSNLNDKQKHLVRTLGSSSSLLKDLISDILDFSKIESGEVELHQDTFDLGGVFEGVISIMSLRASEKGISFVFDYGALKDASLSGDKVRLRQILINLVANAVKFTDRGGVTIKAEFEDRDGSRWLRISVADTGIGIAPENFDMVFEHFRQADSSVSRKYGGTGLGLSISRPLARLMGGDIFLSSETGHGSTFTLLLPAQSAVCGFPAENGPDRSRKLDERLRSLASESKTRLLVVEDYEGNIVVIGYLLDDLGMVYDVARTGKQAVALFEANRYDAILMDVQMPEMDGFTATREIRRLESENNLARTPVIGMTAHALVGDKDKCIDAGMDAYLPKPIVEEDLKAEILKRIVLKIDHKAA